MGDYDLVPSITLIKTQIDDLRERVASYKNSISNSPITARNSDQQATIDNMNSSIQLEAESIGNKIKEIKDIRTDNNASIDNRAPILRNQVKKMNSDYEAVKEIVYSREESIIAQNELSEIKINSNYFTYVLYFFFTIFVVASLIYIHRNPEVQNLDMFILKLAIFVLLYYLYEYLITKAFVKKWIVKTKVAWKNMMSSVSTFFGKGGVSMDKPLSSK